MLKRGVEGPRHLLTLGQHLLEHLGEGIGHL